LARTLGGRTVLLITHRISLVESADLAVVVRDGRVVETGAPRELLSRDSLLCRQFRVANSDIPLVEAV